jgi:deazaflavin-dependent oxidoreductase (nitroreductase family)
MFVLLVTKGRKSGKTRFTPLEYLKKGNEIFIVSARGEKAQWIKNIRKFPDSVKYQLYFRRTSANVEFIENEAKIDLIKYYIQKRPKGAEYVFGWDKKIDKIETADLTDLTSMITIIRL